MIFADKLVDAVPIVVDFLNVGGHNANQDDGADEGNEGRGNFPVIAIFSQQSQFSILIYIINIYLNLLDSGSFFPRPSPPVDDARYHEADTGPNSDRHSLQRLPVVLGQSGNLLVCLLFFIENKIMVKLGAIQT